MFKYLGNLGSRDHLEKLIPNGKITTFHSITPKHYYLIYN